MGVAGMSGDDVQEGPALATGSPRRVAVVGAGMVGLATAWFLQEAGVQVTVPERDHTGAWRWVPSPGCCWRRPC
jgi:glycine/D-amino acid oxidase-like deaminating enzyme